MSAVEFTVVAPPSERVVRNKWAVVLCRTKADNLKVRIEAKHWPVSPLMLLPGSTFSVVQTQLEERNYKGEKRLYVAAPRPKDPALFEMLHQLASEMPELRDALATLMSALGTSEALLDVIDDPTRLRALVDITASQANKVLALCDQLRAKVDASVALATDLVVPAEMRDELTAEDAVHLKTNPYHLTVALASSVCHSKARVLRVADNLAKSKGLSPDDPRRATAHVEHAIREGCYKSGSYWLAPDMVLREAMAQMNHWSSGSLEPAVRDALEDNSIVAREDGEVTTMEMAQTEHAVADGLARIARQDSPAPQALALANSILDGANTTSPCAAPLLGLDADQRAAVLTALSSAVAIITGRAGTGKSSVLNVIEKLVRATAPSCPKGRVGETQTEADRRVAIHNVAHHLTLAAPTGKAANRLVQVTKGQPASTIHSTIHKNAEPTRLALDEVSMLDPKLLAELLDKKGKGLRMLLFVGDDAQLPSVCPGALLRDLLASGRLPTASLTTTHRVGSGSIIAEKAGAIALGDATGIARTDHENGHEDLEQQAWSVSFGGAGASKAAALRRARGLHAAGEPFLMLTQTNATCAALNRELQSFVNPPDSMKRELVAAMGDDDTEAPPKGSKDAAASRRWREGDAVVATTNMYNPQPPYQRLFSNGEKGVIANVEGVRFTVHFEDGDHTQSFAKGTRDVRLPLMNPASSARIPSIALRFAAHRCCTPTRSQSIARKVPRSGMPLR